MLEEQGITDLADMDVDDPLASLQVASCIYRIALGPRARQQVLSAPAQAGIQYRPRTLRARSAAAS